MSRKQNEQNNQVLGEDELVGLSDGQQAELTGV